MSIYGALRSAVSGISSQGQAIGAIADNLSNVNTVGYKSASVTFSTLVTAGGGSQNTYVPGGVLGTALRSVDRQGVTQGTDNPYDFSVIGKGFFVVTDQVEYNTATQKYEVSSTSTVLFSRNGQFRPDRDGNLRSTSGFYLLAVPAQVDGTFRLSTNAKDYEPVNVSTQLSPPQRTTNIQFSASLDSVTAPGDFFETSSSYFDKQGVRRSLVLRFYRSEPAGGAATAGPDGGSTAAGGGGTDIPVPSANDRSSWSVYGFIRGPGDGGMANGLQIEALGALKDADGVDMNFAKIGDIEFDAAGNLIQYVGSTYDETSDMVNPLETIDTVGDTALMGIKLSHDSNANNEDVGLSVNLGIVGSRSGVAQSSGESSVNFVRPNGRSVGRLASVSTSQDGILTQVFDNGERADSFRLPLVIFENPNGLAPSNGNTYQQSADSGDARYEFAGGVAGRVFGQSVESSTTDIALEFSNMIVTQRAYAASTKMLSTADEMLEELIRAKR